MSERSSIPANTTEAHTIAIHGLIQDMREVLDLCTMAWFIVALILGIDAVSAALDQNWLSVVWHATLATFSALAARNFYRRRRKYRARGYERTGREA